MDAFRDYRELLKEKDVDTSGMRPMGAAESNMNLFSRRLKKMGYSWSPEGLKAMISTMIHHFEGTLIEAIRKVSNGDSVEEDPEKAYPSFANLLTEKISQSIGAINGHMPSLSSSDQGKPYVKALRGLTGF